MIKKNNDQESLKTVNKIINSIPGSLVYRGIKKEEFSIERIFFNQEFYNVENYSTSKGKLENDLKEASPDLTQWINVTGLNNIDEITELGKILNINPIMLEQILDVSKHSFYRITNEFIFNNLQMIYLKENSILNESVSIFFRGNILITFQERQGDVFESIRSRISNDEGYIREEVSLYLYFCILDSLVDHYLNVLENIKNDIEKMELRLMENQTLDNKELHVMRKEILILRLSATPIEKLVQEILLMNSDELQKNKKYFDSLSQNIKHTVFEVTTLKESIDNLYENYMMTNSNDMNQIMTILTIFSAIFIPLTFAAGIFGMNFEYIPGLNNPFAFVIFLGGCGLTSLVMILMFRYKKWF